MYSIGEISKLVKISVDTLRYYDEIGLIKPHYVEKGNKYRYYSEQQIKDLLTIIELKHYGFSLDAIKQLLQDKDYEGLYAACDSRLQQLYKEQESTEKMICLLKKKMHRLEKRTEYLSEDKTVLIVDDAVFMRQILQNVFEQQGYRVVGQAVDGREGVSKYHELKPSLVTMDISMPELDGISATKLIIDKDESARIIICSAKSSASSVLSSLQAGAFSFVAKPFHIDYLIETIEDNYRSNVIYNQAAIAALLLDERLHATRSNEHISQALIDKLSKMCMFDYQTSEAEIDELVNDINYGG